jgi:hypothetical protein
VTALVLGAALCAGLGLLAVAAVRRATRPLPVRHEPRVVLGETPEAVAARVCRALAVADTVAGSRPGAAVAECDARVRRVGIRTALGPRLCWAVIRSGGAIEMFDDLHGVEEALVRHIRRHRGGPDRAEQQERDTRSGFGA